MSVSDEYHAICKSFDKNVNTKSFLIVIKKKYLLFCLIVSI